MNSDITIAQAAQPKTITEIAGNLGLPMDNIIPYGHYKAKIRSTSTTKQAKLILVTAINPTPAGEGKTTITVGLGDALTALGKHTVICLREPSLGPVFGMKGGAAGGGYAQVIPMEDINLHFTGDLHAITSANNLLAALLDNHIQQGNSLGIDPRRITWRRVMDMNDRQLRQIVNGLGGKVNGVPREDGFDITAASEIMAVFCLSDSLSTLKENLARIVVGYTYSGEPVTARELQAQGAMTTLLKEAFSPNLVQTLEHTPALIHGGPFANIAHGCNSLVATKMALGIAQDYVITEAGFGADLGAEKFFDIKCRKGNLTPSAVVVVVTVRALKHHGGCAKADLSHENILALKAGLPNLERHVENIMQNYGLPVVVAINRFNTDTEAELQIIYDSMSKKGVEVAQADVFAKGSKGGLELGEKVINAAHKTNNFRFAYELEQPLKNKIIEIAKKIYHAEHVNFSPESEKMLRQLEQQGYGDLPICMAKTQYSFSDDAKKLGAPTGFAIQIRQVRLSAGAGFVVALSGDIMTMPGLPAKPAANNIDIDSNGAISGLY